MIWQSLFPSITCYKINDESIYKYACVCAWVLFASMLSMVSYIAAAVTASIKLGRINPEAMFKLPHAYRHFFQVFAINAEYLLSTHWIIWYMLSTSINWSQGHVTAVSMADRMALLLAKNRDWNAYLEISLVISQDGIT